MDGQYKQFDRELFEQQDQRTRSAVMEYLASEGLYCTQNPDLYGPDLLVYRGYSKLYYIEVECKLVWNNQHDPSTGQRVFPWPTVQLPERKAKFTRKRLPVEFWILSKDLQTAVIIPDNVIDSSMLVPVSNRLVSEGELFFQVPVSECIIKDLRINNEETNV